MKADTAMIDGPEADEEASSSPLAPIRYTRRLSDKVMLAFHQACDLHDLEVAEQLLRVLETMTTRPPRPEDGNRRRSVLSLVAAHERLWHLRHPHAA